MEGNGFRKDIRPFPAWSEASISIRHLCRGGSGCRWRLVLLVEVKLCGSRPVCCVLGTGPQLPGVTQKPGPWCLRAEGLIFKYSSAHIKSFEGGYAFHTTKWTHFERNRLSFEKWVPCLSTVMTEMQVARSSLAHPGPKQMFILLFCHCRLVFAFLKFHLYGIVHHVLSGVQRSPLCACFEFFHVAVCIRDACSCRAALHVWTHTVR